VARTLAVLRVVYIVFSALIGIVFAVASVGYLWQGIETAIDVAQCNATVEPDPRIVTNCYGFDGPDPLSFDSYGRAPVLAVMFFLTAFGAFKRRWEMLRLPLLFLVSSVTVPAVAGVLYDVGRSQLEFTSLAWVAIPVAITVIAARSPANSRPSAAQAALAAVVTASFFWRAIATATGPDLVQAMDTLRGGDTIYVSSIELVSGSIVGLIAAIALLIGAVASLFGEPRVLTAALAFTAGLSFLGFLQVLDLVLGLRDNWNAAYVIQEAVAFVACVVALALVRRQRIQTVAG
jgi:hypothetical protein